MLTGLLTLVAALAAADPRAQAASGGPAASAQAQAQPHDSHDQAPAQGAETDYPSLKISGFGDVNFSQTHKVEGPRGFSEGQFALHMISSLSPRVTFFGEISFSARSDAGEGSPAAPGYNAEIERMILRFDQSDKLKLSFGRYHTPINYWNTAYHHGQWLQTTISRPEMIQFGGRFLPVHFVGALLEGSVPAGGWNVNYKAGVGNGRATVISRAGDAGDNNGDRAWLFNAFSKPDTPYGLEFGGSVYGDTIRLASQRTFDERIVGGYAVWHKEDPEVIAEVAAVRHRETNSSLVTWNHAYYIQAAYRLPLGKKLWKPYYRFEHIGIDPSEVVFQNVPRLDGSTVGVRFDASQFAALKGEYRTWRRGEGTERNYGGFFQLCFTF